jgi:8-oxo-dGTP diphosphatase
MLPYRIAVLCYLYDDAGRVLLLHRLRDPNAGLYSPIGGKLEVERGESPHDCAVREIHEEAGVKLTVDDIRMCGVVAETAYAGEAHWLLFLYEVSNAVSPDAIASMEIDEGRLEWVAVDRVEELEIPETDRRVIWPLVCEHRGGFFVVHVDSSGPELEWVVQEVGA